MLLWAQSFFGAANTPKNNMRHTSVGLVSCRGWEYSQQPIFDIHLLVSVFCVGWSISPATGIWHPHRWLSFVSGLGACRATDDSNQERCILAITFRMAGRWATAWAPHGGADTANEEAMETAGGRNVTNSQFLVGGQDNGAGVSRGSWDSKREQATDTSEDRNGTNSQS